MRRLVHALVFGASLGYVSADVVFTWPAPAATLGSGDVEIWWKEDGDALLISEMSTHLLVLFTGSNNVMTMLNEWVVPIGTYNTTIYLDSNLGPNATNSYFFGIQSNPSDVTNYPSTSIPVLTNFSPRFSLTNMTGRGFTPTIVAANAACDTTDGPDSVIRMESEDQVSFNKVVVSSLSAAQVTMSGVIANPTSGSFVTDIALTPSASPDSTTSSLPSTSSVPLISSTWMTSSTAITPAPTISSQPAAQSQTSGPTFTGTSHKTTVIAVPVALGAAAILGLFLFFYFRRPRSKPRNQKQTESSSILPFFPPPPTHPNTWIDTTASNVRNRTNHFWTFLTKRSRQSVAELPGYEYPAMTQTSAAPPRNLSNTSNSTSSSTGTVTTTTSTNSHIPIKIPATYQPEPTHPPPGREVGFIATGPSGDNKTNNKLTIDTIASRRPNPQTYPSASDTKTLHTTTDASEIPSSTALSFDPPLPFEYKPPAVFATGSGGEFGVPRRDFRSPMGRGDESLAVLEAERRIRGLLGGSPAGSVRRSEGVVSPVSPIDSR